VYKKLSEVKYYSNLVN